MTESRRRMLMTFLGAMGLFAENRFLGAQNPQSAPHPRPVPYPNGRDPNNPQDTDEPTRLNLKAIQQENQRKLRADVSRLYEMAGDLKADVEKTDATSTLSVSLVRKAQEIEKLAKQIRNLAKGLS